MKAKYFTRQCFSIWNFTCSTQATYLFDVRYCFVLYEQFHRYQLPHLTMGRIYTRDELLSVRRIIPLSINPKKNFCSIIRLDILCWLHDGCFGVEELSCGNIETSPSLRQKTVCVPSRYNKETNNPSKTNYPSVNTSWRHTNRRILLHNSSWHRIYTRDESSVWDG